MTDDTQRIEFTDNQGRQRQVVLPKTGTIKLGPCTVKAGDVMRYLAGAGFKPRLVVAAEAGAASKK